jgi:hypothetical protein
MKTIQLLHVLDERRLSGLGACRSEEDDIMMMHRNLSINSCISDLYAVNNNSIIIISSCMVLPCQVSIAQHRRFQEGQRMTLLTMTTLVIRFPRALLMKIQSKRLYGSLVGENHLLSSLYR